jgi:hypothetical protein
MDNFRIIAAYVPIIFGAAIVVMNWSCALTGLRNKKRGTGRQPSTISFLSVICAAVAYIVYPGTSKWWIWIIPAADIGNWMILLGLSAVIKKKGKDS